jgi:hypothetical protein
MFRPPASDPVAFTPGVRGADPVAQFWLRQVTLRLRREVCWLWHERGVHRGAGDEAPSRDVLPMFADRGVTALDLARYADDKRAFMSADVTARYLSERIAAEAPDARDPANGSFGWVALHLGLAPVERFVLAMALLPAIDSAAGSVIATCANDPARPEPTLALAQRLWDEADEVLRCFDPAHPLIAYGLLALSPGPGSALWHAPLTVAPLVVRQLLDAESGLPASLQMVALSTPSGDRPSLPDESDYTRCRRPVAMRVVPVVGAAGSPLAETAAADAAARGCSVVRPNTALTREHLPAFLTTAWLRGCDVYLPGQSLMEAGGHEAHPATLPLPALPIHVFVGLHDRQELRVAGGDIQPPIHVAPTTYIERVDCWKRAVPSLSGTPLASELAHRFRCQRVTIERIGEQVAALGRTPTDDELRAAARAELDLGTLAQPVQPRFELAELMLPPVQTRQLEEIVTAMRNLARVHYEWGTAKAWNEGGLAALFAGPPGTGKTMAAEALATAIRLPMYRIDLSQVVNKYIGETEKNLRRLFDAAEAADIILFFDEADSLFGKRTEVKDAHDRYANLEVSYLLERMERFKGLAILATNRKKDLDPGFARRLRFVIDFPLPGVDERRRIWRSMIPADVDASALDFEFLARQFPLAGGHIRAIVFHACLQTADERAPRRLDMPAIIHAVEREHAKLDRAVSLDQFGQFAPLVAAERSGR